MAYSICISTIFKSIPKIDIQECMERHLGKVSRIDCVDLNQSNRRVFVHFSEWYSNKGKGCSDIVLHQLETNGYCHFYIPNTKNKKNPDFYAKLLINNNPISYDEYKLNKYKRQINYWLTTSYHLQNKIDLLEDTIQTMKLTIKYMSERNQSLSELNQLYNDADYFSSSMEISELN
jgi:hypothetical protein